MATAEPVVGELYGTRAFGVTTDGALTGYNHTGYTWTPGENIADCRAHTRKKTPPPGHPVPEPACRCGFYAYTTASPRWKSNQISGIIAGHCAPWPVSSDSAATRPASWRCASGPVFPGL